VEHQQGAIMALNVLMPALGLTTIILTLLSAFLQKNDKQVFVILIIAVVILFISGLITKFGNQPINALVMTWHTTNVPDDWTLLRDKWWPFHQVRTICAVIAFFLIIWTNIRQS
jgi:hypothetical protein